MYVGGYVIFCLVLLPFFQGKGFGGQAYKHWKGLDVVYRTVVRGSSRNFTLGEPHEHVRQFNVVHYITKVS